MQDEKIANFEEFWPYYISQHSRKATRVLHCVGTALALATVAIGYLCHEPRAYAAAVVVGYAPAWFSHAFIERNRPATFRHPLWSFRADFRMVGKMLRGTMNDPRS